MSVASPSIIVVIRSAERDCPVIGGFSPPHNRFAAGGHRLTGLLSRWARCIQALFAITGDGSIAEDEPNDSECSREVGNKRQGKGPRPINIVLRGDHKWDNNQCNEKQLLAVNRLQRARSQPSRKKNGGDSGDERCE